VSLVARELERSGIPTVILGAAKDIVETVGVPRFAFSDVPLGNPAGKPHDPASQRLALECALRLLETAPGPRTTWQTPLRWSEDHEWKRDFNNLAGLDRDAAARERERFDAQKDAADTRRSPA
jgi:D-proline reductase (dithiol) PrdB